jgi:hypothetical protein
MVTACNEDTMLRYLWPAVKSAKAGGRIYFSTACTRPDQYRVPFPKTDVQPPSKNTLPVLALHAAFQGDKNVTITEDHSVIRVRIGNPPDTILSTNISQLNLTPEAQYNPEEAIGEVLHAKEVSVAEEKLGIVFPLAMSDHIVAPPLEETPHLPKSIQGISVDQALDMVAKTFGVAVIYGAESCSVEHMIDIDFTYNPLSDDAVPKTENGSK